MTIGQISNAKFPAKIHIQSGLAASKPSASSKIVGCLYHATNGLPDGSLAADLGHGTLQVCKQNNATTPAPAWADVSAFDWCGLVQLADPGGGASECVIASSSALDISQVRSQTVVKYWVQTPVLAGGRGILTATIQAGASVTITSTDGEESYVYVEITY